MLTAPRPVDPSAVDAVPAPSAPRTAPSDGPPTAEAPPGSPSVDPRPVAHASTRRRAPLQVDRTPPSLGPDARRIALAAGLAAAVLAATSTGSVLVAALLVGVACADRRSGTAVALAALAASLRFGTTTFDDLAGIQSVLGPAATVGPRLGAASTCCAAAAVVLATRVPPGSARLPWRVGPALATGLVAAALAAGPGPDDLGLRIGASVAGVVLALAITGADRIDAVVRVRLWLAVVLAGAGAVLAGWPS